MISLADLQRRIDAGDLPQTPPSRSRSKRSVRRKRPSAPLSAATRTSRAQGAGPLRGIAVGIKDIMDTADFPTEMGSPIYRGFRPRGGCGRCDDAEAGRCDHYRQDHDDGVRLARIRRRRSIRTTTATRPADRRRARRPRWRPA